MSDALKGWKVYRLYEIVSQEGSKVQPADFPSLPFVGLEQVEPQSMRLLGLLSASSVRSASVRFGPGHVVYSRLRPYLNKVFTPDFEGLGSGEFIVLKPAPGHSARFVAYRLNSPDFVAFANGLNEGDRPRVDFGQIGAFPVAAPELREQESVVAALDSHLSRLDAATATLERAQHNLKRYRASVLKAAVEGRLVPTEAALARAEGRSYEPASVLLERILAERRARWAASGMKGKYKEPVAPDTAGLPELPEGWCWGSLDQLTEIVGGITKNQKRKLLEGMREVPYLRVANVQRGYLDLGTVTTILATESEIQQLRLEVGDVLFNEGGDRDKLGRGWVWTGQIAECIHQNHVFRARPLSRSLSSKYLSWYGNSAGQVFFSRQGTQTTNLASLSKTQLRSLPVPLPPAAEQYRIELEASRLLTIAEAMEAAIHSNRIRLGGLRGGVLRSAFSGELM